MISARLAAPVLCASLGLFVLAGSARAQYAECPLPQGMPEAVYMSILAQADTYYGDLTQKTCDSIVKTAVAACKAQVKTAYKCGVKTAGTHYAMLLKQCAELTDPAERASCKEDAKTVRDGNVAVYRNSMDDDAMGGLAVCDNQFVTSLNGQCMQIAVKVGGP